MTGVITTYTKERGGGKCSSEREITVSSNIGKIYERIIDNRARHKLKYQKHRQEEELQRTTYGTRQAIQNEI